MRYIIYQHFYFADCPQKVQNHEKLVTPPAPVEVGGGYKTAMGTHFILT